MQKKLGWILITGVVLGCVWPATAFDFEQAARDSLSNPSISPLPEGWAVGPALYVAGKTRHMDDAFINAEGNDVTDAFLKYCRPLAGELPTQDRIQAPAVKKIMGNQ